MGKKKKLSLALQIFIALAIAVIAGLLMQDYAGFAADYIKPFGNVFLNLIQFIVVPIVLLSIMSGIVSMQDIRKAGSIGAKTVVYYFCTTAFAIAIGLMGGNLFRGFFPVLSTAELSYEVAEAVPFMDVIVAIFPSNFIAPMLSASTLSASTNAWSNLLTMCSFTRSLSNLKSMTIPLAGSGSPVTVTSIL